jgi:hypothetical protein
MKLTADLQFMLSVRHCFTKPRVMEPLNYSLRDIVIREANNYKYLGIILRSDFSCAEQVNYTVKKPGRHFISQCVFLKKGNTNIKSLAYKSLVRPILKYGKACWDPYREGHRL